MIDTIISVLYYALFFLAPLIMAKDTSELFEFNKMLLIYIFTSGILFFWILKMILHKSIIVRKTRFDIILLLFLSIQIASTIFSIDRHTSFFGYYGRFNGGLLSIISYIILYYGFVSNVLLKEKGMAIIQKLLKTSITSSFLVILWGLPGKLGYDLSCYLFMGQLNNSCWTDQFHPAQRMFSTLGQPDWLGAYLAINFFIGLYFLLKNFQKKHIGNSSDKKGYIKKESKKFHSDLSIHEMLIFGYLCLNFTAVLFTGSRTAIGALLIGLALFSLVVFILIIRKNNFFSFNIQRVIISFCIIAIPIFIFKTGISSIDRFLTFSFLSPKNQETPAIPKQSPKPPSGPKIVITDSFTIRKIVWKGAIDLGNKYPLFGTGLETFAYAYYFVRPQVHNMTSEWDYLYNKAHNEYLNYFATTGYIGTMAYVLMIGFVLYLFTRVIKQGDPAAKILGFSLFLSYLTILITNFFGFSTTTVNLFFYLIPAILIVFLDERSSHIEGKYNSSLSSMQWIMIIINGLATLFLIIYFIRYFFADIKYAQGEAYAAKGDYQTSASLLTEALQLRYEHVYEDKLSNVYANLAVVAAYQKEEEIAKRIVALADSYNLKSISESPQNVLYFKTRAKNEYLLYQITLQSTAIIEGIKALQRAVILSPTDPKIPYSLAIFQSLLSDDEKNTGNKKIDQEASLQEIDKAIDLKPDYRDSYLLKGQLLKKYGNKEGAKKIFQYILDTLNSNDSEAKKEIQSL